MKERKINLELLTEKLKNSLTEKKWLSIAYPHIYLLESDLIAKGRYLSNFTNLKNEYDLGIFLFEKRVKVPKMYCLIKIPSLKYSDYEKDFLIMQRIEGKVAGSLSGEKKEEAIKQLKEGIEKVLELGIIPYDSFFCENSIFNEKEGKLYLIDFEKWKWKKETSDYEIRNFYEELKNFKDFKFPETG
jgi:hypothetical protein